MDENQAEILNKALTNTIKERHANGAYGLWVAGLHRNVVESLLEALGGPTGVYASIIGAHDEEALLEWAWEKGWDESSFGVDSTHAVRVRNTAPDEALKLAFVLQEEERQHSLTHRGYEHVGPYEVVGQVCRIAKFEAPNEPQRNLWEALSSEELSAYLSLNGILDYYVRVFAGEEAELSSDPRESLPLLGMLRDPQILTGRYADVQNIKKRLLKNGQMVERLQRADEEDWQKAVEAVANADGEERQQLSEAYSAFLQVTRSNLEALRALTLPDAERLLSGKRTTPTPTDSPDPGSSDEGEAENGARTSGRSFSSLALAAIRLTMEDEHEMVRRIVDKARSYLEAGEIESKRLSEEAVTVQFDPDARAVALTREMSAEDRFGGTLDVRDYPLDAVLREPGRHLEEFEIFESVRRRTLEDYLQKVREQLLPEFEGESLFQEYLERREALLPFSDLLASSPLACLISIEDALEAARQVISSYERLLSHLEENFVALRRQSFEGTLFVYREILNLDMIRVRGGNEEAVLLSPVSPLVLWKYVELASLVLDRGSELPESDQELLEDEVADIPEPLLAVHAPGNRAHEAVEFGYSTRLGSLPVYRPVSTEVADLSEKSLQIAARKLAALYPPVQEDLRIMLVDPLSTHHVSRAIKTLVQRHGFRRATLIVGRTQHGAKGSTMLEDRTLDELFSDNVVAVEEEWVASAEQLARYLTRRPVHLLGIAGEKRKNVEIIESEGTRLHPLSFPHRLHPDPLMGTVSLQPRSIQPAEGQPPHPFGLYQRIISDLAGNPRSEYSLRSSHGVSLDDCRPLLSHCQFFIVTGHLSERAMDNGLLRLTQGVELVGDTVFTEHPGRINRGVDEVLRRLNYKPSSGGIQRLLDNLQEIGGEGLFATISEKSVNGFSDSALRGQLGVAVALNWYRTEGADGRHTVLSLDSYLARRWLHRREDKKRPDLLGFRQSPDGSLKIDIIEVKSYDATHGSDVASTHAGQQLISVARVIQDMLDHQGDVLVDRRREILRLQVFREGLISKGSHEAEWVEILNSILDGEREVSVNLTLLELDFEQNIHAEDQMFTINSGEVPATRAHSIRRLHLGEPDIQQHLEGLVERINPLSQPAGGQPENESSMQPESTEQEAEESDSPRVDANVQETSLLNEVESTSQPANMQEQSDIGESQASTPVHGLEPSQSERAKIDDTARNIYRVLQDIGIRVLSVNPDIVDVGPSVARYKVQLYSGEKGNTLKNRANDLMRELAAEREPIIDNLPNTNFIYIDLPRPEPRPAHLRPLLENLSDVDQEKQGLLCPIGVTPEGRVEYLDLAKLPHMLVAGSTGAGKTMFLYSLIVGLTRLYSPEDVQLLLIDPKETDFVFFNRLDHLRGDGVITEPQEAIEALLQLLTEELQERTEILKDSLTRDIWNYNARHPNKPIKPIVVFIDEFADLADVMDKPTREQFDLSLRRLAQRARNVGIHIILATQRPTADIVNGNLKSNLPCRVSFRLASQIDSRTILDHGGAEHLLGNGDMLVNWNNRTLRLQGFFLPEQDIIEMLGL